MLATVHARVNLRMSRLTFSVRTSSLSSRKSNYWDTHTALADVWRRASRFALLHRIAIIEA